jgi:hypothetical protein
MQRVAGQKRGFLMSIINALFKMDIHKVAKLNSYSAENINSSFAHRSSQKQRRKMARRAA